MRTYNEILGYVEKKFYVMPIVEVLDNKTLRVMNKISRLIPTISVNIHVDSMSKELISLTYDCSGIVNGLLGGVVGFIDEKIPKQQVEVFTNERQVLVHLDAFEKLDKIFAVVEPTDITFDDDAVVLKMALVSNPN